jgi:ADP-ribose pyrophosphatase
LRLVRRQLVAIDQHGHESSPFVYDELERLALDAVVIAAHYLNADGQRHVFLRSVPRPPVLLRAPERKADCSDVRVNGLWELPAGLVEPDEQSIDGLRRSAMRELEEEIGFAVPAAALNWLGPSTFPAPGFISERHYYFHVRVNPCERRTPSLDGSVLERLGEVIDVPLVDALRWCRQGDLEDAKTELGLRRLAELPMD